MFRNQIRRDVDVEAGDMNGKWIGLRCTDSGMLVGACMVEVDVYTPAQQNTDGGY